MAQQLPPVRRIVTGHDTSGRSIIEHDGPPPRTLTVPERPGYAVSNVWRTAESPCPVHADDDILAHKGVLPPRRGTVIRVIDFPPEPQDPAKLRDMLHATFRALYPDADHQPTDAGHQGMHKTMTIDYAIVLKGNITAIMDDGETTMNAGDILVQRATNHAWANRSGEICRIAFILIDGEAGE